MKKLSSHSLVLFGLVFIFIFLSVLCGCSTIRNTLDKYLPSDSADEQNSGGNDSTTPTNPATSSITAEDGSPVRFLNFDVSDWPQTATLSSVTFDSSFIYFPYDKANTWPVINDTVANPWVIVRYQGQWYAATWEWLRPGQTSKKKSSVEGSHIKVSPLSSWAPTSGERLGFMISGLCRDSSRNAKERSNIVWINWP